MPKIVTKQLAGAEIVFGVPEQPYMLVKPFEAISIQAFFGNAESARARVHWKNGTIAEYYLGAEDTEIVIMPELQLSADQFIGPEACDPGDCVVGSMDKDDGNVYFDEHQVLENIHTTVDQFQQWRQRHKDSPLTEELDAMDEWTLFAWHAELHRCCLNCGRLIDWRRIEEEARHLLTN